MSNPQAYIAAKATESGYALLAAASLPCEKFADVPNPQIVPAPYPCPEVQKLDAINIDAGRDSTYQGYIEYYPELVSPLRMTNGTQQTVIQRIFGEMHWQGGPGSTGNVCEGFAEGLVNGLGRVTALTYGPDRTFSLTMIPGKNANLTFTGFNAAPGVVTIVMQHWNGNQWVITGGTNLINGGTATILVQTPPAGTNTFRFIADNSSEMDFGTFCFNLEYTSVAVPLDTFVFPEHWSVLTSVEWPWLRGLPEVQALRTIAGSLLFTYTGSQVLNGGQVASALVAADWYPDGLSPFASVAALRNDAYNGPMREGTDVTWRPYGLSDVTQKNRESYLPISSKIVIGYQFEGGFPQATARVRAFGLFGVNSPSQVVGSMSWTPAITPEMYQALEVYYASAPAATSNKQHTILKNLKNLGSKAGSMIQHLLSYDDQIAAVLAAMGHPELSFGVKAAGIVNRTYQQRFPSRPSPPKQNGGQKQPKLQQKKKRKRRNGPKQG